MRWKKRSELRPMRSVPRAVATESALLHNNRDYKVETRSLPLPVLTHFT